MTDISEFAPDAETRALISERLSSTREAISVSEEQVAEAMAAVVGVVEKIDFDELDFDFDEE